MNRLVSTVCLSMLLGAAASGCGWWKAEDKPDYEEDLPTLGVAAESESPPSNDENRQSETPQSPSAELKPGTRVGLRKRVVQTLSQGERESRTTLQLDMIVSIDEILDDGRRRFGAHYDRVRYSGQVGGDTFEYDSHNASASLPVRVLPFHGLAGNDFYFWIDSDGRIELVGFDRFLRRCVARLPASERRAVLANFAVVTDEEGVARFVDETVGLLSGRTSPPAADVTLKKGDSWTRRRTLSGSVPMQVLTEYVVTAVSAAEVEIEINGIVGPSNQSEKPSPGAVGPAGGPTARAGSEPVVRVKGGKTLGHCTLDRNTGLPTSSRFEQFIDMQVELEDGTRFDQKKHVLTTIESTDPAATAGQSPDSRF